MARKNVARGKTARWRMSLRVKLPAPPPYPEDSAIPLLRKQNVHQDEGRVVLRFRRGIALLQVEALPTYGGSLAAELLKIFASDVFCMSLFDYLKVHWIVYRTRLSLQYFSRSYWVKRFLKVGCWVQYFSKVGCRMLYFSRSIVGCNGGMELLPRVRIMTSQKLAVTPTILHRRTSRVQQGGGTVVVVGRPKGILADHPHRWYNLLRGLVTSWIYLRRGLLSHSNTPRVPCRVLLLQLRPASSIRKPRGKRPFYREYGTVRCKSAIVRKVEPNARKVIRKEAAVEVEIRREGENHY